jgi:glycosyltransferase involved in cell wall biosynthesis
MAKPAVLVVHNRYRIEGGEERSVELQLRVLRRAGLKHRLLERRSSDAGRLRAAAAMLRGGEDTGEITEAVRSLGADVVHVHNLQPLVGPRGLEAAGGAGARTVLHMHNVRLFCAIGVASRDGGPCFRCHHRQTLPGFVLNCRGSVPEAAVYAAALSAHQPRVLDAVDRFVAPSAYAAGQLAKLGLPAERIEVLAHYLPDEAFVDSPTAGEGSYALVAGRLSQEKGVDTAIRAAAASGVPLRVAGEGPEAPALTELAAREGAPVEMLGWVDRAGMSELLAGAAMTLMPSRYHEFSPYAALEAMGAGVPVVASRLGGLPELIGAERCIPPNEPEALARRMRELWAAPERRHTEGEALIARAREHHSEKRFTRDLLALYDRVRAAPES